MAFIVEMLRLIDGVKSPAEFRCDGDTWKNVLAVAEASGWQPSGTIPDPKAETWIDDYLHHFVPTYAPTEWALCKCVSEEDAIALSEAISKAIQKISLGDVSEIPGLSTQVLSDELSQQDQESIIKSFTAQLVRFYEFSKGGSFIFAWDD